jgi:hypothetical protein
MDRYEKGLAALDKLFENTTAEEFKRDYLAVEKGIGTKVKDYIKEESEMALENDAICQRYGNLPRNLMQGKM